MDSDEYELMPHKEIMELKNELEKLKGGKGSRSGSKSAANSQVESLIVSINTLNSLFTEALKEMKLGDQDEMTTYKHVQQLQEKVDILIDQNEKIAEGIVALADMIKGIETREAPPKLEKISKARNAPPQPQMSPPPNQPSPGFGGPIPPPNQPTNNFGGPIPPPVQQQASQSPNTFGGPMPPPVNAPQTPMGSKEMRPMPGGAQSITPNSGPYLQPQGLPPLQPPPPESGSLDAFGQPEKPPSQGLALADPGIGQPPVNDREPKKGFFGRLMK